MSEEAEHVDLPHPSPRAKRILFVVAVVLVALSVLFGLLSWIHTRHVVTQDRRERARVGAAGPALEIRRVTMTRADREFTLPGDVRGFKQSTLYAKISGYLREIRVDRGDRVKAGQLLAIIESPETDQDVAAALSDAQVKRINAERARRLSPNVVSAQDRDTAVSDESSSLATLRRARSLKNYEEVRAPFDGVITARYVDTGALLPAATSATQSALPIVDIADTETIRVFVYVGQDASPFIHAGDPVDLWQEENPSNEVHGSITRLADALDPRTRTMQCEVDLDNRVAHFIPGTFVRARLHLKIAPAPLVPNEALVFRGGKTEVTVLDGNHVHFVPVVLGDTDGRVVRVLRGLREGEEVGVNVGMELEDGMRVRPVRAAAEPATANSRGQ